ncbi:MAG: hypothetical protein AAGA56_31010, partial [Myxococcota bacterium]
RLGPHYRKALFEALRERRLDAQLVAYLRDGLGRAATRELADELERDSPDRVLLALSVAKELDVDLPASALEKLTEHEDERVAQAAFESMEATGQALDAAHLKRLLAPERSPRMLRALLRALTDRASPALAEIVRPLTRHHDPAVASAACVFRIRAAGALSSFDAEVRGRTAMVRLTGMTLAGDFARELPELLQHPEPRVRRDAIEQMGELRLALFIPPLIACLAVPDAQTSAESALLRFGERAVEGFASHLEAANTPVSSALALLRLLEQLATSRADEALLAAASHSALVVRTQAIEGLWRRADSDPDLVFDRPTLSKLVEAELIQLATLARVAAALPHHRAPDSDERFACFAAEVGAQRRSAERRIFRLLGLLYDRAALRRAELHYRSAETHARSNAIELLEQHIESERHRRFVGLIERADTSRSGAASPRATDLNPFLEDDPWLARLWRWVQTSDGLDWSRPFDRLAILRRGRLFGGVPGEPLLALARVMVRVELPRGAAAFREGEEGSDIYLVLEGQVALTGPS